MTASPAARPNTASTAVILLYVSLGLGVLRVLLGLPGIAQVQDKGMAGASLAIVLVFFAVMFFFVFMISKGRNWARITFLVLYVIGMIMMIVGLTSGAPFGGGAALDLVQAILQLVALVILFSAESNAWFQSMKAARAKK